MQLTVSETPLARKPVQQFDRIALLSESEGYAGESELLREAISRYADLDAGALAEFLDEAPSGKLSLPWEYRRAFRIRGYSRSKRKNYYSSYGDMLLSTGVGQVELVRRVLHRLSGQPSPQFERVLDFGTGRGGFLARAQQMPFFHNTEFWGLDADPASLLINHRLNEDVGNDRFQLVGSKEPQFPFKDDAFDLVVSFSTLEHVGEIEAQKFALEEVVRCLRPGGLAILRFPNRWNVIRPEEHVGVYLLDFLPRRLKQRVSLWFSGMPADDIYPSSYFPLLRLLRRFHNVETCLNSQMAYHRLAWVRKVSAFWLVRVLGPGFVLVLRKG